jgi:hypothetical protein
LIRADKDGKPAGGKETVSQPSGETKATAFVGNDADFYIATTAH